MSNLKLKKIRFDIGGSGKADVRNSSVVQFSVSLKLVLNVK